MMRTSLLTAIVISLATTPSIGQGRQAGAPEARINWNANTPWGPREGAIMGLGVDQQKTDPFKIFDNLYYVGLRSVAAYLVTTSDGLVLIDAGYGLTGDLILDSIRGLGFNPANIRYILLTHQ